MQVAVSGVSDGLRMGAPRPHTPRQRILSFGIHFYDMIKGIRINQGFRPIDADFFVLGKNAAPWSTGRWRIYILLQFHVGKQIINT